MEMSEGRLFELVVVLHDRWRIFLHQESGRAVVDLVPRHLPVNSSAELWREGACLAKASVALEEGGKFVWQGDALLATRRLFHGERVHIHAHINGLPRTHRIDVDDCLKLRIPDGACADGAFRSLTRENLDAAREWEKQLQTPFVQHTSCF